MARALDASEYRCTRHFEAQAHRRGYRWVAGCDEAGRGSLLGPLYAAAVILDPTKPIRGVDDSKKLTPEERNELAAEIRAKAIAFQVIAIPAKDVDALNVYQASRRAMIRALQSLVPAPDFILTDAMPLADRDDAAGFPIPHRAIIHGDARSASIAAASILAKVERDAHMVELDRLYPQYRLAKNKGYGTPEHFAALAKHGPCPEHRQTFQPVKDYLLPLFPFVGAP
ncbi:MAG: ribonuclease HII [Terriglobia bacterium]|jgi:ribonuclease HII